MKKILVPTDFSAFADSALQLAIQIAQKAESEIILLHIMLTNDDVRVEASAEGVLVSGGSEDHYIHEMIKKFRQVFIRLFKSLATTGCLTKLARVMWVGRSSNLPRPVRWISS